MNSARRKRDDQITERVSEIIAAVRTEGDKALLGYTESFDKVRLTPKKMRITREEISASAKRISPELKEAVLAAADRITAYHKKQIRSGFSMATEEGTLEQLIIPLRRVGLYVPGGHTVYPSTVLMDAIPAKLAGVREIVAITPPRAELDPGIAFALKHLGITEVYRVAGAQGVAALALGTATIPAVDKITGPGNAYVQTAKRLLFGTVDIDTVAGPSEVVIIADSSVRAEWVALDLLAQAEHGSGDEIAICITEDKSSAQSIAEALKREIALSPVREVIEKLPVYGIVIIVTSSRRESIDLANSIAPEHLQIMTRTARRDLKAVTSAAAVFLGPYTPVALGDYYIGTNHVLPTGGAARFASPLGVDSFVKRISVAQATPLGLDLAAPYVSTFARAESFIHHALSVERRC